MKYRLTRVDAEEARELHTLAFAADRWPGDDHTYWVATAPRGEGVGFCSAIYWDEIKCVYLSRSAVAKAAQGQGLQRRMIEARVKWAMDETDARAVWTYTRANNYPCIVNLIMMGFQFVGFDLVSTRGSPGWHKFLLPLAERVAVKSISRAAEKLANY
jgi:GNAT superfamily N-acetyltransferase